VAALAAAAVARTEQLVLVLEVPELLDRDLMAELQVQLVLLDITVAGAAEVQGELVVMALLASQETGVAELSTL
jgi:hypothetical protein